MIVRGYAVVWGNPLRTDLSGQYFTPDTLFGVKLGEGRPLRYADSAYERWPLIGAAWVDAIDDMGLYVKGEIDEKSSPKARAVTQLLEIHEFRKDAAIATVSVPLMVVEEGMGRIVKWPIVEFFIIPIPAEPLCRGITIERVNPK